MRTFLNFLALAPLILSAAPSKGTFLRFSDQIQQPSTAAPALLGLVEISAGSANKYELDESTGLLRLDRVLALPLVYPANYGMFPQTLAGDGDALDFLLLSRFPIQPGTIVAMRPVAILHMLDKGAEDQKLICVPADSVDPTYASVTDLPHLNPADLQRIEAFFRLYKSLHLDGNPVDLNGFGNAAEATALLAQARRKWQTATQPAPPAP
ncbi:MAG: hypothetical protein RL648_529 [Verrucomicrobiota bacterium]